MLDSSQKPTTIDRDAPQATPSVHLTRRARIEAERAATKPKRRQRDAAMPAPSVSDANGPVTPPAPSSPVLPASSAAPVTPPAPSSPVVAPLAGTRQSKRSAATVAGRRSPSVPVAAGRRSPSAAAGRRGSSVPAIAAGPRVDRATRHIARTAPVAGRPATHGASFRRTASGVTVVGALLFTAGLVVSTSLPAQALYVPEPGAVTVRASVPGAQSLSVGSATEGSVDRDAYTVSEAQRVATPVVSSAPGAAAASTSTTSNIGAGGAIQWPFPTAVPISSGFGGRQVAGCSFCSTFHQGVDFAPGAGTPIGVVADGTVIKVQANDGAFGNDVWVEHDVAGKKFVSVYGHMLDNSFQVVQGQQVKVGDVVGLVGSTGNSTGPHLHLEIRIDGVPVDPLAWLQANAS
jgi:murein DD-endopeptidase MepM/ murein hydrolase activator NlpD